MNLSGQQIKKLQEALIDAFPKKSPLEQMLLHELNKNLDVIAGEGNLNDVVFNLIETAKSQGWSKELFDAAYRCNSGNPRLKEIAENVEFFQNHPETPVPSANNPSQGLIPAQEPQERGSLERLDNVKKQLLYLFSIEYNSNPLTTKTIREKLFAKESRELKDYCKIHLDELVEKRFLIYQDESYRLIDDNLCIGIRNEFIKKVSEEIIERNLRLLKTHLLFSAQVEQKIREWQVKNILTPIKQELLKEFYNEETITENLCCFLTNSQKNDLVENYTAGNILNILLQLQLKQDFSEFDLSNITVTQADLQDAFLEKVNFTNSDLTNSIFCQPLGCIHAINFSACGTYIVTGDAHGSIRIHDTENRELCAFREASHSQIWSIAFSPDSKKLASGAEDGTVILWDIESSSNEEITIYPHKVLKYDSHILSVAFSSNGNILAIGGNANIGIILQDVNNFDSPRTLQHTNVYCLAFNQKNGNILVSGSNDGTIKLWNINENSKTVLKEHDSYTVRRVLFSPNGSTLASGGEDGKVRLWHDQDNWNNLSTINKEPIQTICDPKIKQVRALAFSNDGKTLAIGCIYKDKNSNTDSSEHKIRLWSVEKEEWLDSLLDPHKNMTHKHLIRSLAFYPKSDKSQLLISGGDGRTIKFWDIQQKNCMHLIKGYANRIWSITSSSDGQTFACCGEDDKIRILNKVNNSYKVTQVLSKHTNWVWSVAFSPDKNKKLLASGSEDKSILLWQWNNDQWEYKATLIGHEDRVRCVVFSPDSNVLASAGNDRKVILWNINSIINRNIDLVDKEIIEKFKEEIILDEILHNDRVLSLAFCSNGQYIASSSADRTIKLKDLKNNSYLNFNETHHDQVHTIAFSLDNRTIVSGSFDQTLKIWNLSSEKCICTKTLKGHSGAIFSVAFHPHKNNIVASAGHDKTIKLWNINKGQCIQTLKEHEGTVESITFSLDGNYLLSASQDQTINIWDISSVDSNSSGITNNISSIETIKLDNLYQDMKIAGIKGLSESQKDTLRALGANPN